ncbi:MAG: MATE family efflux transporter [Bacteroidales bacterium]|nr:MATE family efflux transporter [Bacteroidales bacterium]
MTLMKPESLNKSILKLAIPSILANITVPLVGLVDTAVAGRLGDTAALGAIAIGSMLFDLLYWNFGFLRVGTGGVTAQAFGREDNKDIMKSLVQGLGTALAGAILLISIQWAFAAAAFAILDCSPQVEALAREYFFIRIWAAPATLSLFVFRGWFIGMQNTVIPMSVDITINLVNVGASIYLGLFSPLGFPGIAWGTLIAQYSGLALAITLMLVKYSNLFDHIDLKGSFSREHLKTFFGMNGNLFIRSLCFMGIYCGYTSLASKFGDTPLAVSGIIMKLFMLYSYFTDGFAYAGEALTGRYIGSRDEARLKRTLRLLFNWTIALGAVSMAVYGFGGKWMIRALTTEPHVLDAANSYIIWMIIMPLASCPAFMWDGIYIGATASTQMRNSMILACVGFFAIFFLLQPLLGFNALWYAYIGHLVIRTVFLTAIWPRTYREIFTTM